MFSKHSYVLFTAVCKRMIRFWRPVWQNQGTLTEVKCKEEECKEGWARQEEDRSISSAGRGGIRMARAENQNG